MIDIKRCCSKSAFLIAAISATGTAFAEIEEIVVTAEFRETSVQDTPLAITAISGEMMEARSQTRIVDVAAQAPNVTLQPGGGVFGPALQAFIRGIGQDDFNFAYEPGVGTYVDDIYFSTLTGSLMDLIDVDRIEILRGPQGTLSGKNSIGGSIKLYSKQPEGENTGYASLTYGEYNRTEFRGAYDFSVIPDKLFMRISGVGKSEDGYVDRIDFECENPGSGLPSLVSNGDSCKLGTEGGRSYTGGRIQLRWLASDDVEVNVTADHVSDSSEAIPNQLAAIVPSNLAQTTLASAPGVTLDSRFVTQGSYKTYSSYVNPDSPFGAYSLAGVSHMDSGGLSAVIDWQINENLSLKSITGYRKFDATFTLDNNGSPIPFALSTNNVSSEQFTQELRLSGTAFNELVDYTVGGFMIDAENTDTGRIDIHYIFPGFGHFNDDTAETNTEAVFGHAVWHLNDRMNLTAGIRYTKESKDLTYTRHSQSGDGSVAIPSGIGVDGTASSSSASHTDYRLNVDYSLTDDMLVYAQYATAFKGGGPSPRPFSADQLFSFGPETVTSYELGIKSDLFNQKMRVNAAAFFSQYEDKQIVMFACPGQPCAAPANAGDADIWGIELETTIAPTDNFQLNASLSYLDFEYTSLSPEVIPTGISLDTTTVYTPEWQFSVGAQYEFYLPGGSTLTPRLDGSYRSEMYTDVSNAPNSKIDDYWLWNARLTWESSDDNGWTAALEVTNLANEFYYQGLQDISTFSGIVQGNPAPPRKWAVTIKKAF